MSNYSLLDLYQSFDKFPRIAGHKVFHKFSAPNGLENMDEICDHCGLLIKREEVEKAGRELFEASKQRSWKVDFSWPHPLYRALENGAHELYCMELIPQLLDEVPLREEDEEWEDSGIILRGELHQETGFRIGAVALSKKEVRLDIPDEAKFLEWWHSFNARNEWTEKALAVLRHIRSKFFSPSEVEEDALESSTQKPTYYINDKGQRVQIRNTPKVIVSSSASEDSDYCEECDAFRPCSHDESGESEEGYCEVCEAFYPCIHHG